METVRLSAWFAGAGAKRLSAVEADPRTSHQHEYNGVNQFRELFGSERREIPARFLYLNDDETVTAGDGRLTWYDSRERQTHRSAEYRLYFSENDAMRQAKAEDLLVIAKFAREDRALVVVAGQGTTAEHQLLWLFGFGDRELKRFYVADFRTLERGMSAFAVRAILDSLALLPSTMLSADEELLQAFPAGLGDTRTVSGRVYDILRRRGAINTVDAPDEAVISLLEHEERLFYALEKREIEAKLDARFTSSDDFVAYALSVLNRRKARAGRAFENHLEVLFRDNRLRFSRGKATEHKSKPDFIFPGIREYHNEEFDSHLLTMLGVKTSCKDRWRQILPEADRIKKKHLATLEPSISAAQTAEMAKRHVVLVIPQELHETYDESQRGVLLNVGAFVRMVRERQESARRAG